jgi:glycosyltransferase involved in cell wall biosynthesis
MDRIITISDAVADDASSFLGIARSRFITAYCGIDHQMFVPSENRPMEMKEDKINLLFVGDLRIRKNIHLILEAMKLLGNDYRLIRIGPSRMPSYKQRCHNYAMKNNIDFVDIGYVPSECLKDYYSSADLFVFPSSDEGFGMPPMEAMACGTQCVLSNIPVFNEIYKDNVFFSELDATSLSEQIKDAVDHNFDKKRLVEFAQGFTWNKTAKKIMSVYRELV